MISITLPEAITSFTQNTQWLMDVGIILILAFIVDFIIKGAFKRLMKKTTNQTFIRIFSKAVRILFLVVILLMIMQTVGISISGVLAFGGLGGLAVSLAAKDMIANLFGGLMLYLDKPFKQGEWIRSTDKTIEGTVEHIGWRLTAVRTAEKSLLFVPNSAFSTISVENSGRMTHRRVQINAGLRYEDADKLPSIIARIEKHLAAHPEIDITQSIIVRFINLGASSLNIFISAYTKTTNWTSYLSIQQTILLSVLDIVAKEGAEMAFPTTTVQIAQPFCTQSHSTTGDLSS
ncbi:MAG: Small-conductance mechanosensitive channel [Gammaproteobacteria bacterium]|jgi:MscS family membrane protein|nr:Small-conductance mechanosensitive channel [Gammaproteobacteria bacterium]